MTNFISDLDPKKFADLIKDQNKDVKQSFNDYLADTVDKNYDNLYSKIILNHTEQSYANDLDDIMSWDKMEASDDIKTRLYGAGQKSIFLNDPSNKERSLGAPILINKEIIDNIASPAPTLSITFLANAGL